MIIHEAAEKFHLASFRNFVPTVSAGTVCLKGGVDPLRLVHGSPRLSEDIDFDARVVEVEILWISVNKVLDSLPLRAELAAAGISLVAITPQNLARTQMFLISSFASLRLRAP